GIALRAAAFALLVLGAAGPEWGRELVRRSAVGSDVVLLMDVSASMDVRDVPPSRLEEARREALAVLDRLTGSRVAVVAFAGDAIEDLARSGFRVLAVGAGTPAGDVVPALDDQGRAVDVKRDESGGPVRSRLDEDLLRRLARRTRGAYFAASRPGGELPRLL